MNLDQLIQQISLLPLAENNDFTVDDFILLKDNETNVAKKITLQQIADKVAIINPSSGSSPIIASGEFNLKDVAANVLTWATGCTAANTATTGVVISLTENDTYVDNLTDIIFDLGGSELSFYFTDFRTEVQNLLFEAIIVSSVLSNAQGNSSFPSLGDYIVNVMQGTLNDFRIKIQILGVRID